MQDLHRLRRIYLELKANPNLAISCMYYDRTGEGVWGFTGCSWHGSFALTTTEVRQLWTGDMLVQKPINGVHWQNKNRFKYGSFQFNPDYDPPAYLEDLVPRPCWMFVEEGPI